MPAGQEADIFVAIRAKNIPEIECLIKDGLTDLAAKNEDQLTPMQLAFRLRHWDCVDAIANARKTNPTDTMKYGEALLHAVTEARQDTVKHLLKAGASTNIWYTDHDRNRALHCAVIKRNIPILKLLIEYGADLTKENEDKFTPIELVAQLGYWDCVEAIAKAKKTNQHDAMNYSHALLLATKNNFSNSTIVECLLDAGASVTSCRSLDDKNSCLHWAATYSCSADLTTLNLLLMHNADLTAENKNKHTPIQLAKSINNWAAVEAIANYKDTDQQDKAGYGSALLEAVQQYGHELSVEILLKAKTPVNWVEPASGDGYLHEAVRKNCSSKIAILLQYGADPAQKNKAGQTPIELACTLGNWYCAEELARCQSVTFADKAKAGMAFLDAMSADRLTVASYLQQSGASITEHNNFNGYTGLHHAVVNKSEKGIRFLLDLGADQTALNKDNKGNDDKTPIELASELGYWNCVQLLIEYGNNDSNDKKKIADLHYENTLLNAIRQNNYAIAKLLLAHGAPCHRWNSAIGNIALYWAVSNNNPDMVTLLLAHGADPTIQDASGKTTHDLAQRLQHHECAKRLKNQNDHGPVKNNHGSLEENREEAANLYVSISENAFTPRELPEKVKKLSELNKTILKQNLALLIVRRDTLKCNTQRLSQAPSLLDIDHEPSELEKMGTLIATMQSLLNYPQHPVQTDILRNAGWPAEAKDILDYVERKQKIDEYKKALFNSLTQLQNKINKTIFKIKKPFGNWANFKIKNLFDDWVDGTPDHIAELKTELSKMSGSLSSSSDTIFDIHINVMNIISKISASTRRHPDTTKFYDTELEPLKEIGFHVEALTVSHNLAQTVASPAPVQTAPTLASGSSTLMPSLFPAQQIPLASISSPSMSSLIPMHTTSFASTSSQVMSSLAKQRPLAPPSYADYQKSTQQTVASAVEQVSVTASGVETTESSQSSTLYPGLYSSTLTNTTITTDSVTPVSFSTASLSEPELSVDFRPPVPEVTQLPPSTLTKATAQETKMNTSLEQPVKQLTREEAFAKLMELPAPPTHIGMFSQQESQTNASDAKPKKIAVACQQKSYS